jgi:hypothetical protein
MHKTKDRKFPAIINNTISGNIQFVSHLELEFHGPTLWVLYTHSTDDREQCGGMTFTTTQELAEHNRKEHGVG